MRNLQQLNERRCQQHSGRQQRRPVGRPPGIRRRPIGCPGKLDGSRKPVEISAAFSTLPNGLDCLSEDVIPNLTIGNDLYDHLMWRASDNTATPAIAKTQKQVDATTWQFEINLDYVFQNGDKLTMDDVVFSLTRLRDIPKSADIGKLIDSVTSAGNILTVKVNQADNTIIPRIIDKTIIVNKAYITKGGDDAIYKNPIGTGPYKVTKFVPGATVVLETWSGYPFQKPQITKITYSAIRKTPTDT